MAPKLYLRGRRPGAEGRPFSRFFANSKIRQGLAATDLGKRLGSIY